MSLRRRITLVSAAAVAVAVVLASAITYVLVSNQLHRQVDSQLRDRASATDPRVRFEITAGSTLIRRDGTLTRRQADLLFGRQRAEQILSAQRSLPGGTAASAAGPGNPFSSTPPRPNQVSGYQQLVNSKGKRVYSQPSGTQLPISAATLVLTKPSGLGHSVFSDATVKGQRLRILGEGVSDGYAVQYAQPLTDTDNLLATLRLILAVLDVGGIALAALLGGLVARAAVAPVRRLTEAAEHVGRTQDLSRRIAPAGGDEVGRLAVSFNAMLDALESSMSRLDASVHAQRQLVADASHELRTPITSLRTNIEILQQMPGMDTLSRGRLLDDVVQQIEELTLLITDLIDLARGEAPREEFEEVRMDLLVRESIARTQRHFTNVAFETDLDETLVLASPARLDRALNNLLDNAAKYSPRPGSIAVVLRDGELTVRDHGPGIAPADLPHVFDRFYRGADARRRPGSGLGLAIVRQVVETHGGSITAENPPGGGALLRLTLRPVDDGAPPPDGAGGLRAAGAGVSVGATHGPSSSNGAGSSNAAIQGNGAVPHGGGAGRVHNGVVSLGDDAARSGDGATARGDDGAPPGDGADAQEATSRQSSPAAV